LLAGVLCVLVSLSVSSAYDTDCNFCGTFCSGVGGDVKWNNNTGLYTGPVYHYPIAKLCDGNDNTNLQWNTLRAGITTNDRWTTTGTYTASPSASGSPAILYCCLCGPSSTIYPAAGTQVTLLEDSSANCNNYTYRYYPSNSALTTPVTISAVGVTASRSP